ncbi:MAG TPA: 5'-methylthioadenosine/adenosylhomocysteine nucleosidase [Vicinamibacteria bacterium]
MSARRPVVGALLLGLVGAAARADSPPPTGAAGPPLGSGPVAILTALEAEARPVLSSLRDIEASTVRGLPVTTGTLDGRRVVVAVTGVGKVNAAMTTALVVLRFSPSAVLFTGVAGALDPELHPGDVVIAGKLVQHDLVNLTDAGPVPRTVRGPRDGTHGPLAFEPDARLLALAREVAAGAGRGLSAVAGATSPPRIVFGTIATGDSFVSSRARRQDLHERLSASAVEMEGAAVAQVGRELGVPVLVVRGLSDRAAGDARAEAQRNLATTARNAAEVALAVARRLGPEPPTPPAPPARTAP